MSAVELAVGVAGPSLERRIELADMVAYGGATWDWHRLHYDPVYLAGRGLDRAVVDGQAFGAYLVEQLQDWLGPKAWVRKLNFRFKSMVFAGETIRVTGTITAFDPADGRALTCAQQIHVGDRLSVDADATVLLEGWNA